MRIPRLEVDGRESVAAFLRRCDPLSRQAVLRQHQRHADLHRRMQVNYTGHISAQENTSKVSLAYPVGRGTRERVRVAERAEIHRGRAAWTPCDVERGEQR